MTNNRIKLIVIIIFVASVVLTLAFATTPIRVAAAADDPAAVYKAKCMACHTATAAKFFDATKAEDVHLEAVMKGRKGEKPPFMPGFEAKGMTVDEAKGLVAFMKGLRAQAN